MIEKLAKLTPEEKRKCSLKLEKLYKECCENGYTNDFEKFKLELMDTISYYQLIPSDSEAFLENVAGGVSKGGIQKAMAGVLSALSLGAVSLPATDTKVAAYGGNSPIHSSRIYNNYHNKASTPTNHSINSKPDSRLQKASKKDIAKITGAILSGGTAAVLSPILLLGTVEAGALISDVALEVMSFKESLKIQSDFNIFKKTSIDDQKKAFNDSLEKILDIIRSKSGTKANAFKEDFLQEHHLLENFPDDPMEQLNLLQEAISLAAKYIYGEDEELTGKISRLRFFHDAVESAKRDLKRSMDSISHIITLTPPQFSLNTENSSFNESNSNLLEETEETSDSQIESQENTAFTSKMQIREKLPLYEHLLQKTMGVDTKASALPTLFYLYKWCEVNYENAHKQDQGRIKEILRQTALHGEYIYEKLKDDVTPSGQYKKTYFLDTYKKNKDSIDLTKPAPEPTLQELSEDLLRQLDL